MPELPEVETVRQDLLDCVLNKKIKNFEVKLPKLLKNPISDFKSALIGSKFIDIDRIGKLLMFVLDNDYIVLVHLKMTGQLIYKSKQCFKAGGHAQTDKDLLVPTKYSYINIKFADDSILYFNDMRTFGYWQLIKKDDKDKILQKYGIEPLTENWTWENWQKIVNKHSRSILKAFLLNQSYISGLGNIYVDESCFCAGVLPNRKVGSLNKEESKKLFECIPQVIKSALINKGTTFRDYRQADGSSGNYMDKLQVFRRQGKKCYRCGYKSIKKIRLVGRGTHFCPNCQK